MDQTNSAEILAAQMGAIKAGVSIVTFDEKDSSDAFREALSDSGARGLIVSPGTHIESSANETRADVLANLIPELQTTIPGDHLSCGSFPGLKQIIQVGHTAIRGTIKFKDCMVYAKQSMATYSLPENESGDTVIESYRGGRKEAEYSSEEMTVHAADLWDSHFSNASNPVALLLNLETPLGLASFLANAAN